MRTLQVVLLFHTTDEQLLKIYPEPSKHFLAVIILLFFFLIEDQLEEEQEEKTGKMMTNQVF
jgi:hypothetical protein